MKAEAGQLIERWDHWGRPLDPYFVVKVARGMVTYLDMKGRTFEFAEADHTAFLSNPIGGCGRVAFRVADGSLPK